MKNRISLNAPQQEIQPKFGIQQIGYIQTKTSIKNGNYNIYLQNLHLHINLYLIQFLNLSSIYNLRYANNKYMKHKKSCLFHSFFH